MEIEKLNLKIGDYEICPIPTGPFGLDGGSMFGTVPKVLWKKTNPTDAQNRISLEARALLLKSKDRNILIDNGNGGDFILKYGDKLGTKFAEMYNIDDSGPSLLKSLKIFNITPDDITDMVLTHLHFDHAGGSTTEKNGVLAPTFKNATYYVQKSNYETAINPNIREKASYYKANFEPLIQSQKLKFLNGNEENFIPGLSAYVSNGHTQGHQSIQISDGTKTLVYCGDLIPTSTHVRLAWIMGYDLEPLTIIKEKEVILKKAAENKWYLYFEHDPFCDAAQVESHNGDFKVSQKLQFV